MSIKTWKFDRPWPCSLTWVCFLIQKMDNNLLEEFLEGLQFSDAPKTLSRVQHTMGSQYKVAQNLWCKGKCSGSNIPPSLPTVGGHTPSHTANSKTAQLQWAPACAWPHLARLQQGSLQGETAVCLWRSHVPSSKEPSPLSGTNSHQ